MAVSLGIIFEKDNIITEIMEYLPGIIAVHKNFNNSSF